MSVRVYGRLIGYGSQAVVTRGFIEALGADRLRGIVVLDASGSDTAELGLVPLHPLQDQGAYAEHGVFTGPLNQLPLMLNTSEHKRRSVMVAPNSDWMPPRLLPAIADIADEILTPSAWAAGILKSIFVQHPIRVVPHGVDRAYRPVRTNWLTSEYDQKRVTIMHFSTTEGERKGTYELMQAWRLIHESFPWAELVMVLDPGAQLRLLQRMMDEDIEKPPQLRIIARMNLGPPMMRAIYASAHLICQPSRGEAFGLVPLEAMCCGTPTVITNCTGHTEYTPNAHFTEIKTGPMAPIDDGPGAMAPSVTPEAIATALDSALVHWKEFYRYTQEQADRLYEEWSWPNALKPWLDSL